MPRAPLPPATLACPRCAGPMFLEAIGVLEYACLSCGERRFLGPRRAPASESRAADPAGTRRRSRPHTSRYREPGSAA
jgi:hypothetical protein